jgi:hypothetical protein
MNHQHPKEPHRASAFDIRNIVAALMGVYSVVLVLMGLVDDTAAQRAKTGDVNANLWAGIAMAVFALLVAAWSWLRPAAAEETRNSLDRRQQ